MYPIRAFYPDGKIKYEYLRSSEGIARLRCWDETGQPIEDEHLKFLPEDSDGDLGIRLKYICKRMPVPNFSRQPGSKAVAVIMGKDGPFYLGIDF